MMRSYDSGHHSVVAFGLCGGAAGFLHSGGHLDVTPPEDVIFEIGSITKVFTAILLCLLIEEDKIDPHAPLAEMSGDLADVPDPLTPARLISHTSGLPNISMPLWRAAITPMPAGPYAGFGRADLLRWLRTWKDKPDPAPPRATPTPTSVSDFLARPWPCKQESRSWTCSPKRSSLRWD